MKKNTITLLFLSIITIILFKDSIVIKESILNACTLFLNKVFPSLFPMFILCDLFIYAGLPELLSKIFGNFFSKLFHTSPYGSFAFFMSLFSGTPANAYILKELVNDAKITNNEASYILSFSFFSNPLFYYTMLKLIFPNINITKLFIAPYITNLFIGLITRNKSFEKQNITITKKPKNFSTTLINSINKSINTMLMILGTITFFYILNAIVNQNNNILLTGLFEVSQGLNSLININISLKLKELLTLIFVSFGGLSIHLQIKSILSDTKISFHKFFKARIIECLLSIFWLLF